MANANQTKQATQGPDEITRVTLDLWPDVGRKLGLGRNSTFKAAKAGQIPTIKIGKRLLVSKAAFEAMLAGGAAGRA